MCEAAEAPVVKTSAVWTSALACAGGSPMLSIAVFVRTPYAMPSAPSTNCATNPIPSSSANSVVRNICPSLYIFFCHALLSGIALTPHAAVAAQLPWRSILKLTNLLVRVMDLLDVSSLQHQFDLIICTGV